MFLNSCYDIFKKSGLLVFLLMLSMVFKAHASDTENSASAANKNTVETRIDVNSDSDDSQQEYNFPRWPQSSRPVNRERVPLAPPGPYMSSALSDFSFEDVSFDRRIDRAREEMDRVWDEIDRTRDQRDRARDEMRESEDRSTDMSMDRFSPDVSWPSNNAKAPSRWMPEDGYRFVEQAPRVNQPSYQVMPYNPQPGSYYRHGRATVMQGPVTDSRRQPPGVNGTTR